MRVLFLTHNPASLGLSRWLEEQGEDVQVQDSPVRAGAAAAYDHVVSYGYRHIIPASSLAGCRFINLHISLLPWNRGADPNVWSHLERTPSGVSIHEIDPGVDTGPVFAQRALHFQEADTLGGSWQALQLEVQSLFRESWADIRDGRLAPRAQEGRGTRHRAAEFQAVRERLLGVEGWEVSIGELRRRWGNLQHESC